MIDARQVVYDIERCICHVPDACRDCSHDKGAVGFGCIGCMEELMKDALVLLKKQEAKPVDIEVKNVLWDETDDGAVYSRDIFYHCPSCGEVFARTNKKKAIRYCYKCGQEVKWE